MADGILVYAPDSRILYASMYQRRRTACCMNGGGPGSGIWKSTDGGDTWTRFKGNGLPDGPLGGRQDLSHHRPGATGRGEGRSRMAHALE